MKRFLSFKVEPQLLKLFHVYSLILQQHYQFEPSTSGIFKTNVCNVLQLPPAVAIKITKDTLFSLLISKLSPNQYGNVFGEKVRCVFQWHLGLIFL